MGKLSKEEQARFSGANWLLELAKKNGLEEAEKEVERRGIRNMPLKLKDSDVDVFVQSERDNITRCLLIDAITVLADEFGFGKEMCDRFVKRFNARAFCLDEGYVKWQELRDSIKEELGIWIPLSEELENKET